ncbi:hypothetical protein CVT24_005286 [Panaeolus cyanescens]|uniref:G domain-containing protein n=1 Tax=Panaeolus cyanescens TaxID=181874 RepID=A0A409Y8P6_9AGAR|nr:hypothetical protein CVT24_005286 [Panaeolus cyanescens]
MSDMMNYSDWLAQLVLGRVAYVAHSAHKHEIRFIEALANDGNLGISKNQLESYTQTVTVYEVVNAKFASKRIYLMDSPGFSDSNLSEMEIVEMVKNWMAANSFGSIDAILYFCPVTDTRLPGTRRKTMDMLKALVKSSSRIPHSNQSANEGAVTLVTTMWDQVWCERVEQRAEKNYLQLKYTVWKDMIEKGACITKFMNTQGSALEVLDEAFVHWFQAYGSAYYMDTRLYVPVKETFFLYQDLITRIETARQSQRALELNEQAGFDNPTLKLLAEKERRRIEYLLEKYEKQLKMLENPPGSTSNAESESGVPDSPPQAIEELVKMAPSHDGLSSPLPSAALDANTASFTPSTQSPPQTSVVHDGIDQSEITARQDAAVRDAIMASSTETTQLTPQASGSGVLRDTGRLPRRSWMRTFLRRLRKLLTRERVSREETQAINSIM